MRIKICGVTNLKDASMCVANGVWAVGFNFYQQSPRYICKETAQTIITQLPAEILKVGLFVSDEFSMIAQMMAELNLDLVQIYTRKQIPDALARKTIYCVDASEFEQSCESLGRFPYILIDAASAATGLLGGSGQQADWDLAAQLAQSHRLILAGGLHPGNIHEAMEKVKPFAVDVASGVERAPGVKCARRMAALRDRGEEAAGLGEGYFGTYGGCFAPETLMAPLKELATFFLRAQQDPKFQQELTHFLAHYVGRPTPLYEAKRLSMLLGGARIFLKREDLTHTGAHKINNALGQGLLAKYMGKKRLIAETGAGQHGVATATIASLLGLECVVYMGAVDMERQALNVQRMRLLGAQVCAVTSGSQTLKDATSQAMRDWVANPRSYYVLGSALGPHPYPTIVREFQRIIGEEARRQILEHCGRLPDELVACVGGGSNAIGLFSPFLPDKAVRMTGVEAGGRSLQAGEHAARFATGKVGVLQGTKTYLLQDEHGQILPTHSISAGLDYPGVGPEHAYLHDTQRVRYTHVSDAEALAAANCLMQHEGIIPALESSHALAYVIQQAPKLRDECIILVGLSGRGDKDLATYGREIQ